MHFMYPDVGYSHNYRKSYTPLKAYNYDIYAQSKNWKDQGEMIILYIDGKIYTG